MPALTIARGALVVAAAASLGGLAGYRHGLGVERGRHALAMQDAIVAAAEAAHADAQAESKRRQEAALRAARGEAAARAARLRGLLNAAQQGDRPGCAWPADRRMHINAAIDAANGRANPAPGGVHGELPDVAGVTR